jgi:Cu+-exporting ATPase
MIMLKVQRSYTPLAKVRQARNKKTRNEGRRRSKLAPDQPKNGERWAKRAKLFFTPRNHHLVSFLICKVSDIAVRAAVEPADADRNVPVFAPPSLRATPERVHCFHCGEPCPDSSLARGEKAFCCHGCLVVHDLLAENGLAHFYTLNRHPGVRMRASDRRERWAFLDEPALQQRLLDFSDGQTSRVTFHVPAIHCIACVWLLENLFRLHPGIRQSQVNFPRREVSIHFAVEKIQFSELVALLASIGYEPALTLNELEKRKADPARKRRWVQTGLAGFAFGNIMLFSLPRYLGLDSFSGALFERVFGYLSLGLAAPVVVYSASDYWKSALLSARRRVLTLDVPIALGLAAIYGQSAFEIFTHAGGGYCDSLTGLVFFLLCGRAFQQRTHGRMAFDRDYKSFFPLAVTRKTERRSPDRPVGVKMKSESNRAEREFGVPIGEESVSLSQLQVGDRIILRNGELIPADAKLMGGAALIDYSFVTGESEPVAKSGGDYLYAGGKQTGGAIEAEIVKAVSQSYLMSLWNHETFQKNRDDNLNSLTNLYSRRFTLLVVAVAIAAALFWTATGNFARGLKAFTSVLIVACPCALALAAPFTLGTAQRLLARLNVFVKNVLVLERMARVDAIVFDKTGTLTAAGATNELFRGEPLSEEEEIMVCSLAFQSTHPYSRKIHDSLRLGRELKSLDSFMETPGLGIEGRIGGHAVWLGSRPWFESRGLRSAAVPAAAAGNGEALENLNACSAGDALRLGTPALLGSCVHVAMDGKYRGVFVLANDLRPQTDRLLQKLAAHYEIALLSGDSEKERERFWSSFGSDALMHFNQSPLDKLAFIRRLQESGRTVMMVGDGLNDAGALKQSDVGVAVVEEVGAFSPASDVILEAARVPELFEILKLARSSTRIVRLSFGISAAYNLVGISIASAGILSPLVCAVLMPVSSASVVLFACGVTTWAARRTFGVRWRSEAATSLSRAVEPAKSGGALRFPPRFKLEAWP